MHIFRVRTVIVFFVVLRLGIFFIAITTIVIVGVGKPQAIPVTFLYVVPITRVSCVCWGTRRAAIATTVAAIAHTIAVTATVTIFGNVVVVVCIFVTICCIIGSCGQDEIL
jgi:hypothetical protein